MAASKRRARRWRTRFAWPGPRTAERVRRSIGYRGDQGVAAGAGLEWWQNDVVREARRHGGTQPRSLDATRREQGAWACKVCVPRGEEFGTQARTPSPQHRAVRCFNLGKAIRRKSRNVGR